MPARRAKTAERAWQGSPVAKRRPRNQNTHRRHRGDRKQRHRNPVDIVGLPEQREQHGRLHVQVSSGAAAAERGAEGDALREGKRWSGAVTKQCGQTRHRRVIGAPGGMRRSRTRTPASDGAAHGRSSVRVSEIGM